MNVFGAVAHGLLAAVAAFYVVAHHDDALVVSLWGVDLVLQTGWALHYARRL